MPTARHALVFNPNVNEPLARPSVSMVRMRAWKHNGTRQPVIPKTIRLTGRFDSELDTRSGFDQQAAEESY
jgi:hypothetical protein